MEREEIDCSNKHEIREVVTLTKEEVSYVDENVLEVELDDNYEDFWILHVGDVYVVKVLDY